MKATAAVLIQLIGLGAVLHWGPYGLPSGLLLLIAGGALYRREHGARAMPAPGSRLAFRALCATAAVLAVLVSAIPWADRASENSALDARAIVPPSPADSQKCVFVLHGLARPSATAGLAAALGKAGFDVSDVAYRSTRGTVEDMVAPLDDAVAAHAASCSQLNFVGYSLGALVIRSYLGDRPPPNLGRVVMIAPPNRGSELADVLGAIWLFRMVAGGVAADLGTGASNLPRRLPEPRYPVGVIAGDRVAHPLGMLISGPNDGAVSVASTKLDGMTDFLLVHRTHHFIASAPDVIAQTVAFLNSGHFNP